MNNQIIRSVVLFASCACTVPLVVCSTELETSGQPNEVDAGEPDTQTNSTPIPEPIPGVPEFVCDDGQRFRLELPCEVGRAPLHSLVCGVTGAAEYPVDPKSTHGLGLIALDDMAANIQRSLLLQEVIPVLSPLSQLTIKREGVSFALHSFTGYVVFSQVDVKARGFLGRLMNAGFVFQSEAGASIVCHNVDGLLWAVPGDFL